MIKGGVIITLTLLAATTTVVWAVIVGRTEGLLRPASAGDRLDDLLHGPRL